VKCMHCGRPIHQSEDMRWPLHDNMLRRCLPFESGQPYGLEAEVETAKPRGWDE
jgi:hypothetical protein